MITLSLAYSFRKMFLIGQNLKHDLLLINFSGYFTVWSLFLTYQKVLYVNTNFQGNQSWNKNKHFHLLLLLILKNTVFLNGKLKFLMNVWFFSVSWTHFQKLLFADDLKNRCSWKFRNILNQKRDSKASVFFWTLRNF